MLMKKINQEILPIPKNYIINEFGSDYLKKITKNMFDELNVITQINEIYNTVKYMYDENTYIGTDETKKIMKFVVTIWFLWLLKDADISKLKKINPKGTTIKLDYVLLDLESYKDIAIQKSKQFLEDEDSRIMLLQYEFFSSYFANIIREMINSKIWKNVMNCFCVGCNILFDTKEPYLKNQFIREDIDLLLSKKFELLKKNIEKLLQTYTKKYVVFHFPDIIENSNKKEERKLRMSRLDHYITSIYENLEFIFNDISK